MTNTTHEPEWQCKDLPNSEIAAGAFALVAISISLVWTGRLLGLWR